LWHDAAKPAFGTARLFSALQLEEKKLLARHQQLLLDVLSGRPLRQRIDAGLRIEFAGGVAHVGTDGLRSDAVSELIRY
jgi:hypothetical protein